MAQFDVFKSTRGTFPLVVDLQADLHARLATRVVAPLVARTRYAGVTLTRLTPIVKLHGVEYVVVVPMMAAIQRAALGDAVDSLASQRSTLIAALDLLVTGS